MLVIPRKKDEAIVIGDGIEVTVIGIQGDEVRLAIDYPKGSTVHRGEVWATIRREAEEATPAG
jgi:carbon storage regulator